MAGATRPESSPGLGAGTFFGWAPGGMGSGLDGESCLGCEED